MTTTPQSLHGQLRHAAYHIKSPDAPFLHEKSDGEKYSAITYREALDKINALSAHLVERGLSKGDCVAIMVENCPEYLYMDQALIQIGCVNASIYHTLQDHDIEYIINDSGSKAIMVGTLYLYRKIRKLLPKCPQLEVVFTVFHDEKLMASGDPVISLQQIFDRGAELKEKYSAEVESRFSQVTRSDLATLIYTSGTTGVPKGVMLTHDNFMSNIVMGLTVMKHVGPTDRFLSFLPLSHVYERMCTYYLGVSFGAEIAFAQSLETIAININEVKPTLMATVPRLLERMEERVRKNAEAKGGLSKKIFYWALDVGKEARLKREAGEQPGPFLKLKLALAEKLVFSKVKARLGGKMRMFISGGAALPRYVGEFFGDLGIKVLEGYGLTETSPFVSINEFDRQVFGTVGRTGPMQQVRIVDVETGAVLAEKSYDDFDPNFESAEGEIWVKGPNIMKGYWNKPEETAAVLTPDGWFKTGDVGRFYKGYLQITDRIKNMLLTAYGKNVYPTPIENTYLRSSRIEQIFLIGDKREHVTAIIVPSKEELIATFQLPESFFDEEDPFIHDPQLIAWVEEDVKRLSATLAKFERIKNFTLKRRPFSLEAGEITVTQKAKRKVIEAKYAEVIEQLYVE